MASLFLIAFNGDPVPEYAYPDYCKVDVPHSTGERSGRGRLIGQRGFPTATLRWDKIPFEAWDFWARWVNENQLDVPVTSIILPSIYRRTSATGDVRPNHRSWSTGYLVRIRMDGDHYSTIYNTAEFWEEGPAVVEFNRLGGVG